MEVVVGARLRSSLGSESESESEKRPTNTEPPKDVLGLLVRSNSASSLESGSGSATKQTKTEQPINLIAGMAGAVIQGPTLDLPTKTLVGSEINAILNKALEKPTVISHPSNDEHSNKAATELRAIIGKALENPTVIFHPNDVEYPDSVAGEWESLIVLTPKTARRVQGNEGKLVDSIDEQPLLGVEVHQPELEPQPEPMPSFICHPRTTTQPQIFEFRCIEDMVVKLLCLPAIGCLVRALCGKAWPSEMKRLVGVFALIGGLSAFLGVVANIIVGVIRSTAANSVAHNGTEAPVNFSKAPTNAPLAYSGVTSSDSVNIALMALAVVVAIGAMYFGATNAFCPTADEPPKEPPKEPSQKSII